MQLLLYITISTAVSTVMSQLPLLPHYHQDDYDVKFERAEMVWYDSNYARDLKITFPFYNRTQRIINATAYLLTDMKSRDLIGEVSLYKFLSNEYRPFPLQVSGNLCDEYDRNRFNCKDVLKNISNATPCPLKKGFYYVKNLMFDCSRLPPFIPRGRYKGVAKVYYEKHFVAEGHAYAEVIDKPIKIV